MRFGGAVLIATLACLAPMFVGQAWAQKRSNEEQGIQASDFVGAWRLVKFTGTDAKGNVYNILGEHPEGQVSYGVDGHVSAHLVNSDPTARFMPAYNAYYGHYRLDLARGIVIHHVEGSNYPGFKGSIQERKFAFQGNELLLSADLNGMHQVLVWKRLRDLQQSER